ncbi:hypothetical protein ACVGOW_21325 [Pseudonocardia saturnea]
MHEHEVTEVWSNDRTVTPTVHEGRVPGSTLWWIPELWWRRPDPRTARPGVPRRGARGRLLRAASGVAAAGPPAPTPVLLSMPWSVPMPASLTTAQLCVAWQRSYFVLLSLPVDGARGEVVAFWGRLLDEIESRDPDGFTRWLATGARASSDPGRYLAGDR